MPNPVGPPHVIGGVIHVQIYRDPHQKDPTKAFSAEINAPGVTETLQISNGQSKTFPLPGVTIAGAPANPTLLVEVENFTLLPSGCNANNAKGLSFSLVFKIVEIFKITIGSIPVTATL